MTTKRSASKKRTASLTPYITVRSAASAIAFYKAAFGAKEVSRSNVTGTDVIQHAELTICRTSIYLCDEFPDAGILSPLSFGGSSTMLHLNVEDANKLWAAAVEAGAVEVSPLVEVPWGGVCGKIVDPFGHYWSIASDKVQTEDDVFGDVAAIEHDVASEPLVIAAN